MPLALPSFAFLIDQKAEIVALAICVDFSGCGSRSSLMVWVAAIALAEPKNHVSRNIRAKPDSTFYKRSDKRLLLFRHV
ncbi:hypothetical protein Pla52o_26870 [Novipirellula galeiformis]|uniref:Uncharacterized protein n=1 Tax=Novipirellula galeiformis TaxID=2528004 RepID=A0A5C6CG46_9BACT|nr:hypothetical protein Pla52o_26870 [Novipirellula galeiformis]